MGQITNPPGSILVGNNTFAGVNTFTQVANAGAQTYPIILSSVSPGMQFIETDAPADEGKWDISINASAWRLRLTNDAGGAIRNIFNATRTAGALTLIEFGNATNNAPVTILGTGLFTTGGPIKPLTTTVGALPAAGNAGRRATVTDANAPTFGAAVAAGGAVTVPVYDTGAAWFVG